MVEKILNNTTRYGKIRALHEGSLHSSTLKGLVHRDQMACYVGGSLINSKNRLQCICIFLEVNFAKIGAVFVFYCFYIPIS